MVLNKIFIDTGPCMTTLNLHYQLYHYQMSTTLGHNPVSFEPYKLRSYISACSKEEYTM